MLSQRILSKTALARKSRILVKMCRSSRRFLGGTISTTSTDVLEELGSKGVAYGDVLHLEERCVGHLTCGLEIGEGGAETVGFTAVGGRPLTIVGFSLVDGVDVSTVGIHAVAVNERTGGNVVVKHHLATATVMLVIVVAAEEG